MQQQRSYSRSGVEGAGVSWLLNSRDGLQLIEHGGNLSNLMVSTFSLAPTLGLAVSVMGNTAAGSIVGTAVRDLLLDRLSNQPKIAVTPMTPQPELSEYVGRYASGQWDVEVVELDGTLDFGMRLTNAPEVTEEMRQLFEAKRTRVTFTEPDVVTPAAAPGAPIGDFIRDGDGTIKFFRTGMRLGLRRG